MAEVQFAIAEEQANSAEKIERQTKKLLWLTWSLVALTFALLLFTVALYEDAHLQIKRDEAKQHDQFQNPKTPETEPSPIKDA